MDQVKILSKTKFSNLVRITLFEKSIHPSDALFSQKLESRYDDNEREIDQNFSIFNGVYQL